METKGICIVGRDGKEQVLYNPTIKQLEYHSRTEPNVLFWGGRGSGKSMCGRWDAHLRALSHPGFTYVILRRTYPELQRSHLVHIQREMALLGGEYNATSRIARYPNGSQGFFSHCATEEDVLKLLSAEFALAFFDELSTFEWGMFTKLAASVRVPVHSGLTAMVRAATNPLGPSAQEILKYFVNKDVDLAEDPDYNPNDWYSIHANLEDNPYLDEQQYRKRFSGLPAHVRKAWVEGEFVLENALFDFRPTARVDNEDGTFKKVPYHVIPAGQLDMEKILKTATIYRAIDVGWFPDPTIVLWIAHLGNRHIVLKEQLWYKTIAPDIAKDIKDIDESLGIRRVAMTYCDPTMDINTTADVRTIKEIFENNGITMENSVNNRELFASTMHTALAEEVSPGVPRIQFYAPGCPYLIKTIPQQRYNPKRPLAMADHPDDHGVVAACYYLMSHSADPRNTMPGHTPVPRWMQPKNGATTNWILGRDNVRDDYKK
jgi:hypothetical protein